MTERYISPLLEITEFIIEKGFAASPDGSSFEDFKDGGTEDWD